MLDLKYVPISAFMPTEDKMCIYKGDSHDQKEKLCSIFSIFHCFGFHSLQYHRFGATPLFSLLEREHCIEIHQAATNV